jgi:hypothetical protein
LAGKEVGQSSGDPVEGKQKSVHLFLNLFMLYDT